MTAKFIIYLGIAVLILVILALRKDSPSKGGKHYAGKAKLIGRFTDKEGCFLCEFEMDGEIINAVYGDDDPALKVGDEVDIVYFGLCTHLPHVMNKKIYDRDMQ